MAQFGEMLSELRQFSGMAQKELAEKLHVSPGTISNYENGVHFPDVEKLIDLADIFDVSTDYLLGRCSSELSPDVLNCELLAGKSAGKVIQEIQKLSDEHKRALAVIMDDMRLAAVLKKYGEEKP